MTGGVYSACGAIHVTVARIGSPHSAVVLFQIGGALNGRDAAHSAVGNRDARYVLNVTAAWERA